MAILLLMLLCLSVCVLASAQEEEELYNQICSSDHLPLAKVSALLDAEQYSSEELTKLRETCDSLNLCQGLFIQEGKSSKGKTYTATVDFYFSQGQPFCHVEYTNYGGTLSDAPVEAPQENGYLLASFPTGTFYNRPQPFTIHFSPESLHIQWGDSCDYTLKRSSGDVSEYANEPIPFEERELYQTIVDLFSRMLGDTKHQCAYSEAEKTFYVYVTMGENLRTLLLTNGERYKDTWSSILDGFIDITERVSAAVSLEIREGIGDVTKAHCTVMMVDFLNSKKVYDPQEAIAIIKDGKITYDLLKDGPQRKSSQSTTPSGYTPTIGERNALRSAKDYLKISAFSRSGLIDQLKYEGYSQKEAEYAVDHCGADWYVQAAKSAEAYLNLTSFSRSRLIDQLKYEGFTYEQAVYGVTQNGY